MTLADDGSGIRQMVTNKQLPCLVDNANASFEIHSSYIHYRVFTFDRVIPFSCILSDTRQKCVISVLHDNVPYKIMCPGRIWQSMSKKVYTKIKLKILHALRRFHQSINKNDGGALVRSIRSTCDNVSQTTAQFFELRNDSIKLHNLSEWRHVRYDLLQLYRDY